MESSCGSTEEEGEGSHRESVVIVESGRSWPIPMQLYVASGLPFLVFSPVKISSVLPPGLRKWLSLLMGFPC